MISKTLKARTGLINSFQLATLQFLSFQVICIKNVNDSKMDFSLSGYVSTQKSHLKDKLTNKTTSLFLLIFALQVLRFA